MHDFARWKEKYMWTQQFIIINFLKKDKLTECDVINYRYLKT